MAWSIYLKSLCKHHVLFSFPPKITITHEHKIMQILIELEYNRIVL